MGRMEGYADQERAGMGDQNSISGVEPIEPNKIIPLPSSHQEREFLPPL